MNLIIIDHEPYSFRKKHHYYIDVFISDGWNVEYWGVNRALDYVKNVEYSYEEKDSFVIYYDNVSDIIESIKSFDSNSTIFILEMIYNTSTVDIYKTIKERSFRWVKIDYYFNPTCFLNPKQTFIDRLLNFKTRCLHEKINSLLLLARYKNKNLNIPDVLFVTGSNREGLSEAKKVESLDYFDVEVYEQINKNEPFLPFRYILFLDIMLVNHPDFQRSGEGNLIDKELYFDRLNLFFDQIENHTGFPVVIASHPKANYTNEFGSRLCIKHKTAELTINSEFVLTHGSLSISFALLAKKQLIYIYSQELFRGKNLLKTLLYKLNKACTYLGSSKINIDDYVEIDYLSANVDEPKYANFLDLLYLSSSKASVDSNFNILKSNFKALLNEA